MNYPILSARTVEHKVARDCCRILAERVAVVLHVIFVDSPPRELMLLQSLPSQLALLILLLHLLVLALFLPRYFLHRTGVRGSAMQCAAPAGSRCSAAAEAAGELNQRATAYHADWAGFGRQRAEPCTGRAFLQ